MEFRSILDMEESPGKDKTYPAFFQDLNLDQIIERIRLDWGEAVSSFYYYFPANSDCEDYRREILADIRTCGLYESLCSFSKVMKRRREAGAMRGEVKSFLQKAVWHLREAGEYCTAYEQLYEGIKAAPLKSRGMEAFRTYLDRYLGEAGYTEMKAEAERLLGEMEAFRLVLTYENDKIAISVGEVAGSYDTFLEKNFPGHKKHLASPFLADPNLVELEEGLMKAFRKRNPAFFVGVEDFCQKYEMYADNCLLRFASEIGFYLSFLHFERKMQERGFSFSTPVMVEGDPGRGKEGSVSSHNTGIAEENQKEQTEGVSEPGEQENSQDRIGAEKMQAAGLYDLALACAGKKVIANDMALFPGERFFILTGPNQGGKTTFARSLGQLVYFAKMGLDVPAVSARVYRFTDLLTHFSVEESVETGRGKLREELERLANIMAVSREKDSFVFVVINELFTTAANYDASIMGRRVLDHFLAQGSRGIYVTHLGELAGEDSRLVSLRAVLDEKGRRTFQVVRSREEAPADAGSLVGKHGLTYRQLKERLR